MQQTQPELEQVPDLPIDVVAVLLRHVPPLERLASCALVCKAWNAACCSSIDSMSLSACKQQQAHNAFSWLTKHGKGVTSVRMVVSEAAEKLCLDCELQVWSWLMDLRLTGFNLRQGPLPSDFPQYPPDIAELMSRNAIVSCRSSSKLGELTSLTRLDLDGCSVPDDLAALSPLTNLEHLTLSVMAHDPTGVSCLPFQALSKLTYLHIGVDVCDSTCSHLSCLVSLQQLHISKYAAISSGSLGQIGALQQLTYLRINCASYVICLNSIPSFSELSGLKHLEVLDSRELNPNVLAALTGLEHLVISETALNPRGVSPIHGTGIPTLLSVLPAMQQLTYINLTECLTWPQPVQAYSGLTASPRLARMVLKFNHYPKGMCEHLFGVAENRVRPHLTHLTLHSNWAENVTLEAGDVHSMVKCCPGLKHLNVDVGKQSNAQLQPLRKLTGLIHLSTIDIRNEGLSVLGYMHNLRYLDIERAKGITAEGLFKLTRLKKLTQLRAPGSACTFGGQQHCRVLHLKSRQDLDGIVRPDVQRQLLAIMQGQIEQQQQQQEQQRRLSSSGGGSSRRRENLWDDSPWFRQFERRNELLELRQLIDATEAVWLGEVVDGGVA